MKHRLMQIVQGPDCLAPAVREREILIHVEP